MDKPTTPRPSKYFQVLLDTAGKIGGEVSLPPGKYLLRESLRVPSGVSL